jgi:hypothetical protein
MQKVEELLYELAVEPLQPALGRRHVPALRTGYFPQLAQKTPRSIGLSRSSHRSIPFCALVSLDVPPQREGFLNHQELSLRRIIL